MKVKELGGCAGAIFSDDRKYRYALWRIWDRKIPAIVFIGLNPSVANEYKDDPTVRNVAVRAQMQGHGGVYIGNLFALVGTYPSCIHYDESIVGEENDSYLIKLRKAASLVIVGWGNLPNVAAVRTKKVLDILGKPVYCFGVTASGMPRHPLYLPYSTILEEYHGKPL